MEKENPRVSKGEAMNVMITMPDTKKEGAVSFGELKPRIEMKGFRGFRYETAK